MNVRDFISSERALINIIIRTIHNFHQNRKDVENLSFFNFWVTSVANTRTFMYAEAYGYAKKQRLELYLSGNYLGSALVGVYSIEQLLKSIISLKKTEKEMDAIDEKSLGFTIGVLKEYGEFRGGEGAKIIENLYKLNKELRNQLVVHSKGKKLSERHFDAIHKGNLLDTERILADTFKGISFDVLMLISQIETQLDSMFCQRLGGRHEKGRISTIMRIRPIEDILKDIRETCPAYAKDRQV
ncbi:MAG: hypothetical protein V1676_00070 [Candidatus Diapherotrites archaeon]